LCRNGLAFLLLYAFDLFLHKGMNFFLCGYTAGFPLTRACPSCRGELSFSLLYAFDLFLHKGMNFFLCGYTAGFPLARACPSCRGGLIACSM